MMRKTRVVVVRDEADEGSGGGAQVAGQGQVGATAAPPVMGMRPASLEGSSDSEEEVESASRAPQLRQACTVITRRVCIEQEAGVDDQADQKAARGAHEAGKGG